MIKINNQDVEDLIKVSNYLDNKDLFECSNEITKVAQSILYFISQSNKNQKENIIKNLIKEVD